MSTAEEIQKIALEVYNNKMNYKDNDYICIMALLKESYMRIKGFLGEGENENEKENESEEEEEEEEGVSRYANYDSEDDDDSISYTSTYLSPY
jgi:hypothetical protein